MHRIRRPMIFIIGNLEIFDLTEWYCQY